jgi:hypothetical protein
MNKIKAFTLAGLIGLIALAGGTVNQAAAQGDDLLIGGRTTFNSATMPTDQNTGFVQEVFGDALGRKAGDQENSALIGLLKPADQKSITDGTSSADQRGGFVQGVYGDLLGRKAGDGVQKVGPGTLTLGSLNGLRGTGDLFANSKGGDQGNGLLLPAVRGGSQQAHGTGGGGGAGKVQMQDIHFSGKQAGPKTLDVITGAGSGGPPHVKVFDGAGPTAGGGPHVAPGAVKGLNLSNTAKK